MASNQALSGTFPTIFSNSTAGLHAVEQFSTAGFYGRKAVSNSLLNYLYILIILKPVKD